VMWKYN